MDSRCSYAYSGCLEPRGYDELGPKGYIDIEVDKKLALKFVEFSRRRIDLLKVDVSGCHSTVDVIAKIRNESKTSPDNLLRIELVGQADFDKSSLLVDVNSALESSYYSISVKDKTKKKIDIDSYRDEKSIRGEFIRMVEQDSSLSDEEKAKVIELGFDALSMGKRRPSDETNKMPHRWVWLPSEFRLRLHWQPRFKRMEKRAGQIDPVRLHKSHVLWHEDI